MRVTGVPLRGYRGHLPRPTALLFLHTGGQASGLLLQGPRGRKRAVWLPCVTARRQGLGSPGSWSELLRGWSQDAFPASYSTMVTIGCEMGRQSRRVTVLGH